MNIKTLKTIIRENMKILEQNQQVDVVKNEDLKNLIIKMAKIRKFVEKAADSIRKCEQEYSTYMDNNQKRELGKLYYDLDKISSDMKVFRDEFAEQSGLFNNLNGNQPNIEDNIKSILPNDLD